MWTLSERIIINKINKIKSNKKLFLYFNYTLNTHEIIKTKNK